MTSLALVLLLAQVASEPSFTYAPETPQQECRVAEAPAAIDGDGFRIKVIYSEIVENDAVRFRIAYVGFWNPSTIATLPEEAYRAIRCLQYTGFWYKRQSFTSSSWDSIFISGSRVQIAGLTRRCNVTFPGVSFRGKWKTSSCLEPGA